MSGSSESELGERSNLVPRRTRASLAVRVIPGFFMVAARCAIDGHLGNETTGRLGSHGCGGIHHAGAGWVQRGHGIDRHCPDVNRGAEGSLGVWTADGEAVSRLGGA